MPKDNGYQLLHASLIGPNSVLVKIKIRTEDIDQIADMGIAEHWVYK